jgi:two-component system, chemotaxis family, response regulator Rcp1
MRVGKLAEVLVVEDSPSDTELINEAWSNTQMGGHVTYVQDGVEALQLLRRQGRFATATRPDLMILDLHLPCKDGLDVLAEVKADRDLASIPVVVLTASLDPEDVTRAYNLRASCYVKKPMDFTGYVEAVRSIEKFWCSLVRLPAPKAEGGEPGLSV